MKTILLVKDEVPSVSILEVTLLDSLLAMIELGNNGTYIAILRDDISLVIVEVINFAQWRANSCSSALSCLVNLG